VFSDEMMTDDSEAAAKQHDDKLGELGLVLLQNNVRFLLLHNYAFIFSKTSTSARHSTTNAGFKSG